MTLLRRNRIAAWTLLFVGVFLFGTVDSFGAVRTWVGGTSGNWSTPSNWGGTVPGSSDVAVITGPVTVILNAPASVGEVRITGEVLFRGDNTLTIGTLNVGYASTVGTLLVEYISTVSVPLLTINTALNIPVSGSTIQNSTNGPRDVTILTNGSCTISMADIACYIGNATTQEGVTTWIKNEDALLSNVRFEGDILLECALELGNRNMYLGQYSDMIRYADNNQNDCLVKCSGQHTVAGSIRKNVHGLVNTLYPFIAGDSKLTEIRIRVNSLTSYYTPSGEPWPWLSVRVVDIDHPANMATKEYRRYWVVNTGGVSETCANSFYFEVEFHMGDIQGSPQSLYAARYTDNYEDVGMNGAWYGGSIIGSNSTGRLCVPLGPVCGLGDITIGTPGDPVPVELTAFSARYVRDNVELNWQTATELNNYGFAIERSEDGDVWNEVDFVPGHGNSYSPKNYTYTDMLDDALRSKGQLSYRLRQVDRDGTTDYSNIVVVRTTPPPAGVHLHAAYPNPFNPATTLSFSLSEATPVRITVYSLLGRQIATLVDNALMDAGFHTVGFNGNELPSGAYVIELNAGGTLQRQRVVLSK